MNEARHISTDDTDAFGSLKAGDSVLLSGTIYTARDAAHKRIAELIRENKPLPFPMKGAVIYYAGPTPARDDRAVGSCGPTTSSRMDKFTPELFSLGMTAAIGKGERSKSIRKACAEYGGVYFCAIGGAGALCSKAIISSEVTAFEDLGCESIKRMIIKDFPLIVATDAHGNDIFTKKTGNTFMTEG